MGECDPLRPRMLPNPQQNPCYHVTPGDRGEPDGVTHASAHTRAPACWEEVARGGVGGSSKVHK